MTLEQLRIFVAVAERQHVTRAAEALGLTQSAVSAAVSALEQRHATRLFHRVGRRVELSEAGRLFLDEAHGVLRRASAAELALAELSGLKRGTLAVQASQTIASYWLPAHLARYREAYPDIAVTLAVGNTATVSAAVLAGSAELGFVEGAVDEPALLSEVVARDELVLVVGAGHPWWASGTKEPSLGAADVGAPDLAASRWVLREPGSGTRSTFEVWLAGHGLGVAHLRVTLTLPTNEAVRAAVEAGAGATVISAAVAAPGLEAGRLRRVPLAVPARDYVVLRSKERYRSRAAAALLEFVAASGTMTASAGHAAPTRRIRP